MSGSTVSPTLTRSTVRRAAPTAALVASAGFAVEGVISLVHHTGDRHWDALSQVLNGSYGVAVLALVLALPATGALLGAGRVGRAGVLAAQAGCLAMAFESAVSGAHGGNVLGGVFFGGLLLSLVGLLALGVAGVTRGRARWLALLPFLGMVVGILGGEHGGSLVTAAVWVVVARALARGGD